MATIPIGANGTFEMPVTREITVAHFHPELPEVLGTPFMIYAMELAAARVIEPYLPEGSQSVGVKVDITHLAATPVGFTVTARAEVTARRAHVTFRVEAHDGIEKIGEGTHVRGLIQRDRFEKRLAAKRSR